MDSGAAREASGPIDGDIAGVGTRMMAALVDSCLMLGLLLVAALAPLLLVRRARGLAATMVDNVLSRESIGKDLDTVGVAVVLSVCLAALGYYVIAELTSGGRSPGKRALGLRVVRVDGRPMGVLPSVVRNLLRFVDWLPGSYGVGLICVVVNAKTRRLGDLAAGTIVVRERAGAQARASALAPGVGEPGSLSSVLSEPELALITGFRARGSSFAPAARARLARQIAPVLRARLADASTLDDESWLWALVRQDARLVPWPVQEGISAAANPVAAGSASSSGSSTER